MGMATAYQAIRPFLSLFFDETYGLAPGKTGSIIGVMQLIGGFSALLIPGIAIRLGNVTTMALLRFVGGLMVLLIVGLSALPIVLFCLLAHYSVVDGTEATFVTEAMRRLPHSWRTTFAGLAAMLWSLCSALVASISGYLQDQTGGFDASFALGAAALITSACWLRFAYHRIPDLMTAETRARTDAFLPAQSPVRMD
jgi:cyanate permease